MGVKGVRSGGGSGRGGRRVYDDNEVRWWEWVIGESCPNRGGVNLIRRG